MDSLHIIKVGGNIIDQEEKLILFLKEISSLPGKKLLVHGGGKLATGLAVQLGIHQKLIEGRRLTDSGTLKVVTMVYAGLINKSIVSKLQSFSCNALGLSGADGNLILAHKRVHEETDYGFVGDIDSVNVKLLNELIQNNIVPVIAPITHDGKGQLLNTNADTIAQELAVSLSNNYDVTLIYIFEKAGVLIDLQDGTSVITSIDQVSYSELKSKKIVSEGMVPKIENAFSALKKGVGKVIIGRAEDLSMLIHGKAGTTITNEQRATI